MTSPPRPPQRVKPSDEPGLEESRSSGWRIMARVAIVVTVLGITLMWIYAFFGTHDVPGRLADTTFPTAAEPVCAATVVRIDALPKAPTTPDPARRADVIDQGTAELDQMLANLRAAVPGAEPEHGIVTQWLEDWDIYVQDRRDYTSRLRQDANARFYVTQSDRDRSQITKAVDHFAQVNKMESCAVPSDVG